MAGGETIRASVKASGPGILRLVAPDGEQVFVEHDGSWVSATLPTGTFRWFRVYYYAGPGTTYTMVIDEVGAAAASAPPAGDDWRARAGRILPEMAAR